MFNDFDVVIVGAGIAGCALACALSSGVYKNTGALRIALVEARKIPDAQPPIRGGLDSFDPRVSALTRASCDYFQQIGVWPAIEAMRCCPFQRMQVWDARGTGEIGFDANAIGESCLGHIVENRIITAALVGELRRQHRVEIFDGSAVAGIVLPAQQPAQQPAAKTAGDGVEGVAAKRVLPHPDRGEVELENGQRLQARLIVAADGAQSPCRSALDMPVRAWDYKQDAIVCTVAVTAPHQYTAWQSFTADGPLAYLPLASVHTDDTEGVGAVSKNRELHYCSIVWSQARVRAQQLLALPDCEFRVQLAKALEFRLGEVASVSGRYCFPLHQQHAVDYVSTGFALIADAAHTVHPLAGQGINLGIADVKALARTIADAATNNLPVGELAGLQSYQRERKTENLAMMAVVEGFKRLYEPVPLPLMWLRNWGMHQVDRQPWVKNQILKYAMGVS